MSIAPVSYSPSAKGQKQWKAVYVRSRAEKKIYKELLNGGIEAYVPLIKTLRQWSDRKKWIEEPLIKGYVFVHVSAAERDRVFEVAGIVNYLRFHGQDAIVRDEEIYSLRRLVETGYPIEACPWNGKLQVGDYVKITSGPLKGVCGKIIRELKHATIEVLLTSLQKLIRAKVPVEIVMPLHVATIK